MLKFSAEKVYALFDNPANKKIISEISACGAQAVLFPTLETEPVSTTQTSETLNNLSIFDWLIFPDIYTVEFFLQNLRESEVDFFELDNLIVCACGESVADRLRYAQLHADIIPNSVNTAEILQTIKDYLFDESELENLRFLVLKKNHSFALIAKELKNRGAAVSELEIYRTISEETKSAKVKTLLKGGAIDEFIFTSPFDVINLAHLFPNENLADVLAETKISAADQTVWQSLREFRLT